jgi:PleD family two-component response regulator
MVITLKHTDMNRDALHIVLADSDQNCQLLFSQALKEIKIKTILHIVDNGFQLMDYLNNPDKRLPNIVFLDYLLPYKNGISCLKEIRQNRKLQNLTTAIYSHSASDGFLEDAFVNGANVYFERPYEVAVLKAILEQVCNLSWQYSTSGLRKENFMLNINKINVPQKTEPVLEDAL